MRKLFLVGVAMAMLFTAGTALGQKDKDEEPTSWLYFNVIKEDNGKPVRNAAVVLHPVNLKGKQERGGLELKTSPEGKADLDGIPYGKLRVQVLAHGFQTFGEDYEIDKGKTEITIKMKRPQGQFSVYDDAAPAPKQETPPPPPPADSKKPN
jgi:hypothetical protein